ncbi:MAG TPA: L-threonylcarbamoyladenylate synthase [Burkholderiales bacterium]|jgi:tRNA threonylcarbamoyl adenosine modification protein (Sua5/YciO/YrdC/YwlC family)|nr:L-threonylcarbamoyladenylate synthase [Burkholderiales bacterium]
MAQYFDIHPTHPQLRLVRRAADIVRRGGLIAYPTDSRYALGCHLDDAKALDRLRRLRGLDDRHHLTLMCRDLSEIAAYAVVDDAAFRFLKLPGSYTFILKARRQVPRRIMHARRKTIGVRLPGHPVAHALLEQLGEPLLSATLSLPGESAPLSEAGEIRERLERQIDLIVDSGPCGVEPSTVIDLTGAEPVVVRQGKGSLAPFAVHAV